MICAVFGAAPGKAVRRPWTLNANSLAIGSHASRRQNDGALPNKLP